MKPNSPRAGERAAPRQPRLEIVQRSGRPGLLYEYGYYDRRDERCREGGHVRPRDVPNPYPARSVGIASNPA